VIRGGARPLWGVVDLCSSGPGACPLDDAAEPHDRGAMMIGAAAEAGAGYRFRIGGTSLDVIASYAIGRFDGYARNTEPAIDGLYQGFVLELGLLR
jgi:hypothetical protein